jgi:hypothetical protein
LFALQADYGISQVFPRTEDFYPLDPGEERVVPLRGNLTPGFEASIDVLKLIAAVGTARFRWLELPALDKPLVTTRGGQPANALERLLSAVATGSTRSVAPGITMNEEWTTAQLSLRILP